MNPSSSSFLFLLVIFLVYSISASAIPVIGDNDVDEGFDPSKKLEGDKDNNNEFTLKVPTLELDDLPLDDLLSFNYYHKRCPDFEAIINRKVHEWINKDYTLAPSLLRLHFHDCFGRGCDASILLNHEGSERTAAASKTLRGFEVIDDIKAELENKCPKTVSCTDILSATTRDATVALGGPYWSLPYGRKDSRISIAKDADELVPMGHENVTSLLEFFQSKGLNVLDLVVLSGAHTIGRTSCESIQYRLYNYKGTGKPDSSIDAKYLNFLQRKCRWGSDYVDLDATTPRKFDNMYYKNLEKKMGLLSTDQLLYSDPRTSPIVGALADTPSVFKSQFGVSMARLADVQILSGKGEGEIRTNCNYVNSY
ncbi:Peroxidase [Quillaja saponaria]|uniref:Peroxidase n=1 Tax=Quillaja saponaria TaxID=32244 RepID=A0AAD7PV58_QUISA|nr:Peroxidase [Quillaja saponaria]